jgi:hypothetical protein
MKDLSKEHTPAPGRLAKVNQFRTNAIKQVIFTVFVIDGTRHFIGHANIAATHRSLSGTITP